MKVINEDNFEAPEEDKEVQALKLELGKARLAKEKFKSAATHIRKECTELQEETRPLREPLNKKPKGPARRNMAEINSEEHCGVATMSSNSEERKETGHGCMA